MTDTPPLPTVGFNQLVMTRHGPMLANRNDIYVGTSVIRLGEFSRMEGDFLLQLIQPGQVVIEAGANIGAHTVPLAQKLGPTGFLLAFEPQRIVFQTLCANLALNSLTNVAALPYAVGDARGKINMAQPDPDKPENFGGIPAGGAQGEAVDIVMLDDYPLPACQLIKIDVEGMEAAVLRGAVKTILRHRPILYVENDRRTRSPPLIQLIVSLGYTLFWNLPPLDTGDNFNGQAPSLFPNVASYNMLCLPANGRFAVEGLRQVRGPHDWPTP